MPSDFPLKHRKSLRKILAGLSTKAVWQVRLSEVRRQTVPDSRSSCTEGLPQKVVRFRLTRSIRVAEKCILRGKCRSMTDAHAFH